VSEMLSEILPILLAIPIAIVGITIMLPLIYPELSAICAIVVCSISLTYAVGFIIFWQFGNKKPWIKE